jgi:hypothetical protein
MAIHVRVVNMIPQSQSNETNDDSETNVAVNPADPRIIGGTAFTNQVPNIIFLTTDSGDSWIEAGIVPASAFDYNAKFTRNDLYCGDITGIVGSGGTLAVFQSANPGSLLPMAQIDAEPQIDQPWMAVETVAKGPDTGKDRVFAAYTNWNAVTSVATIDISQDGTAAVPVFNSVQLENRGANRNAPSVRPAIHPDGTVYAAYMDWRAPLVPPTWGSTTSDVIVARDDKWGTNSFKDLIDPGDSKFGVSGRDWVQHKLQWLAWPRPIWQRPGSSCRSAKEAQRTSLARLVRHARGQLYPACPTINGSRQNMVRRSPYDP